MAGIEWTEELRDSAAIITGSCMGGRFTDEIGYWELFHHGRHRVHPLTIPLGMSNAGASHISMEFGLHGPAYTFSTACSSSAHAIGNALWMVRSGAAPLAIAGGSEAPLFLGGLKAWEAMRVVSPDTCRPFSAEPLRNDSGGRRRHVGSGAAGACAGARGQASGRDCGFRHVGRCVPRHPAFRRRRRPRDPCRAARWRVGS